MWEFPVLMTYLDKTKILSNSSACSLWQLPPCRFISNPTMYPCWWPTLTRLRYSATAVRPACDSFLADSSAIQQCTPADYLPWQDWDTQQQQYVQPVTASLLIHQQSNNVHHVDLNRPTGDDQNQSHLGEKWIKMWEI